MWIKVRHDILPLKTCLTSALNSQFDSVLAGFGENWFKKCEQTGAMVDR
jgi:hypothetical protein